jgi:hypothetical protein
MRYLFILIGLLSFGAKAQQASLHCGYDFTSYVVLEVHETGKKDNIKNLKVTIVDSLGREVINVNNVYSWKKANQPMKFSRNYPIDADNKALPENTVLTGNERWFFPFAKDTYLLSVSKQFPADSFSFKVEDVDGPENGGKFKTVIIPLHSYNMYVLCSNESQQAAAKFGRKMNKPIDVVLEKE